LASYLLELEARIKAYESEREELSVTAGSVSTASEATNVESTIHEDPASRHISSSGFEEGQGDIHKNPLIEGAAHLVLSPEGERRKEFHANTRAMLIVA
jgi:hypothetical protein